MTFDPAGNIVIDAPGDPQPVDQSCTHTTTPAVTTTTTTRVATAGPAEGATASPAAPIVARADHAG